MCTSASSWFFSGVVVSCASGSLTHAITRGHLIPLFPMRSDLIPPVAAFGQDKLVLPHYYYWL